MTERITSRQNPLVARLRRLGSDRALRRQEGVFLCDGLKLVEEALTWKVPIETLVTAEGWDMPYSIPPEVRHVVVPGNLLQAIATVESTQGVLAVCQAPALELPQTLAPGRYIVLDGVQDPGNVGTIWRTADAFGATGLILLGGCADPFSPKTVRSTMGACFRLPAWECDLNTVCRVLAGADIPLFATALRADTVDISQVNLHCAAVIIGSEGRGVSPEALAQCSKTIKIPMAAHCESLNAAVAATVVLWQGM